MAHTDLDSFFSPRSIAIVGASGTPGKIGAVPLRYLVEQGYAGTVYPVNPGRDEIMGIRAYNTLREIDGPVDLAIFAIPAAHVEAALDDAIAIHVKNIVMFSAGFAELGGKGEQAQRRLEARARGAGIRVLGPNCLGFMNASRSVYATFSPVVSTGLAPSGAVGIATQSGAFGAYAYGMARERNVGLSTWVATGNESDIDVADCISWMARDPATRVIMAYMEGCKDGAKLKQALALASAAGKPVVIVKVGRTELGALAAASHTAALAGDDAAYDALFRQYGAWRARTIDEFFDVAHCLAVSGLPANGKLGLLTVSGGVGVLMADDAAEAGLDVAPLPQTARDRILERVPFAATRNPVDVTGQVTSQPGLLELAADAMLRDGGYGSLIIFLAAAGLTPEMQEVQIKLAIALRRDHPQSLVMFSTLADPRQQLALERLGCMTFPDPSRAIRVLAAMNFFRAYRDRPREDSLSRVAAVELQPGPCNEAEALDLLGKHGVPVVATRRAHTREEAVRMARELGFPVVMKVLSAHIPHKTEVGGVVLNLPDAEQVAAAYDLILERVRVAAPGVPLDGVLVAPMVQGGVECILGAHLDPVLGPIVMLGLGGVQVELLRDVAFRVAPVNLREAHEMIGELKTSALLRGFRGTPQADTGALANAIVRLSRFADAAGERLDSVDINPFSVFPLGQGAVALDAVVLIKSRYAAAGLRDVVLQTLPLFEMARMRSANTARRHPLQGFAGEGPQSTMRWANQFTHTRKLIGPQDREVVTPNNDTLFTNAWLDLSNGPVIIEVPEMGDRYWVLGFLDAWTNPWAYAGRRTTGGAQQRLFVHGPGWDGDVPAGTHRIAATGDDVWVIGRILVDHDPEDLERVHALQDRFAILRVDGVPALSRFDALLDGRHTQVPRGDEYLRVMSQMLTRNPPEWPLGSWPPERAALDAALAAIYRELREPAPRAELGGGWTIAVRVHTHFGNDFSTRARVARNWIGTLGMEEAMYVMAEVDAAGEVLDGRHRYLLRLPPQGQMEVDAFWSLTLYRREDCLLVANPMGRHSVGDRTRGLRRDADGGLAIVVQAWDPGPGVNWLPSPPDEEFYLVLRLYQPRRAHLDAVFRYPPVERIG